jgi:DNA (cytosine-5)-methyltransferase 1
VRGYQYNIVDELIVDNFAGGGGASTGIELATGRIVDIAVNHDQAAIKMHEKNHPYTKHFCEDVWEIDPRKVTAGRSVALVWCSPDCKHFSKAKGGAPVSKHIRGLAWVAVRWAATVHPRVIILENVEEFMTWGPIKDGKPIKEKSGRTFNSFVNALKRHGYEVDWRVMKASDYGAPTSRKRFFLIARSDGRPIVFPKPTHGKGKGLKKERTAAECIDFTDLGKSIFGRKKSLAANTMKRIARGLDKFVIKSQDPFIMQMNFENPPQDINEPLSTITAVNKHYVANPKLSPYIMSNNTNNVPHSLEEPLPTITTEPKFYLVAPHICTLRNNMIGQNIKEPLSTITAKEHHAVVSAYLTKLTGKETNLCYWCEVRELLNEYAGYHIAEDEILIIEINKVQYFIADISMRMLEPRELAKAQGFPEDYVLQVDESYSKSAQIARIGNSVCPVMSEVLVRANLPELCGKKITTMEQLDKILTA